MRVLLLHNRYRNRGGEERHLELLGTELEAQGVEVNVRAVGPTGASVAGRVLTASALAYNPAAYRSIRDLVRHEKIDVVHAHNLFPSLTPAALHGARAGGAKTVLTTHNYRLFCPAGTLLRGGVPHTDCIRGSSLLCGLRGARESLFESVAYGVAISVQRRLKMISRWADAIIAPSQFNADRLVDAGFPAEIIRVIPYGVTIGPPPAQTGTFGLFAGRLSPEKGVRTLLDAARRAPDVPIVVAGAGQLSSEVSSEAPPNVTYVGQVAEDELVRLREQARFVVVPSEWPDVLPFVALDALASSRRLIVTNEGGLPEIVGSDGSGGAIVPSRDPRALASAMVEAWHSDDDGDDARRRAQEHFELRAQTRTVMDLYEAVLAAR